MTSSDDSLPEVDLRFLPTTSTPADAKDDVLEINSSSSSEGPGQVCVDCALIQCSLNVSDLRLAKYDFELKSCSAVCLDYTDPLAIFTKSFCLSMIEKDILNKKSIENLKRNVEHLFSDIFDLVTNGRWRFYCQILEYVEVLGYDDKDKMATLMNEIANLLVGSGAIEFDENLDGRIGRAARKSLFRYIKTTSNFLALQAVLETLLIFFKKGVDIRSFLPESISFLTVSFSNLPSDENSLEYHRSLSNITRKIITDVLYEKSIEVHELKYEEFMNDIIPSGRDPYLYFNKKENLFCHLVVFSPRQVYLEKIQLQSLVFDEEAETLATDHWTFVLKSKTEFARFLKMKKTDAEHIDNYDMHEFVKNDKNDKNQSNSEESLNLATPIEISSKAQMMEDKCKDDGESEFEEEYSEDEDETVATEVESGFKINQSDIKDYWDADKRIFIRETAGRDWPMMYGCPCAVVVKYNKPKVYNSRKRNLVFARCKGYCVICKAEHKFKIPNNPFRETVLPDGSMRYETISDMVVLVKVEGRFYVSDGKPDIKRPYHEKEKAKGLDLRGEERRLLGMKASLEGAASVYREGMAYLQKDQIENSNRTSVRSLPVIR